MTSLEKYEIRWNWVWLLLFSVGFGIFLIVTPKYFDDYWYLADTASWFEKQGIDYPSDGGNVFKYGIPEELLETIHMHLNQDTARLCNVVAALSLLLPKWVASSISWIALIFTLWGIFRLCRLKISRSWLVAIGIGMVTLTFLWYEVMGDVIYQFNYIVSGGLCVGLLLLTREPSKGVLKVVFLCLYAFITGLWHEGFTVPLLGSYLILLFYRENRNNSIYIATLILFLCVIWHFGGARLTGSSTYGRIFRADGLSLSHVLLTIYYHRTFWIALGLIVIFILKKGIGAFLRIPLLTCMTTGLIVAWGISSFTAIYRGAWWGDIAATIIVLYITGYLWGKNKNYKGWRGLLSTVVLLLSYFELMAIDIHTFKFAKEYRDVIKKYNENPGQPQFSPLIDYPWIGVPFMQMMHNHKYRYGEYPRAYYRKPKGENKRANLLTVVPEGLRNIRLKDTAPLEGDLGIRKYGPYMVAMTDSTHPYDVYADMDYGWFKSHKVIIEFIPFVSDADGLTYAYVMPIYWRTEYELGNVKGVWFNAEGRNDEPVL